MHGNNILIVFFSLAFPMGSEGIKPSRREWLGGEKKLERGKTRNFPPENDLCIGKLIKLVMLRGKFQFFSPLFPVFRSGRCPGSAGRGSRGCPSCISIAPNPFWERFIPQKSAFPWNQESFPTSPAAGSGFYFLRSARRGLNVNYLRSFRRKHH